MRLRRTLVMLATTLAGALVAPAAASAEPVTPFIIGGGTVSSAPWAAAVFSNGSFTCSGTIIAARWVLTARHCVNGTMSVRVGSVNRSSGGVTSAVSSSSSRYDLALLYLSTSINTSYVTLSSSYPPVNSTNSIYGWGMTCYSGCSASSTLKTADVRVTSTNVTDANAWRGDSGGPEFYNGAQVGVASTADGANIQNYGSVAYNRSWISSVAGV
jgi:secreted trypsin-like serine protease